MEAAVYLLLAIGHLGLFDVLYFHTYRARLTDHGESRREVLWHTLRHAVYALQFLWVAHLRFHGAAVALLVLLYAADAFIAVADVLEESHSRASQGGLPRGEYLMHVVLSVLVGACLTRVAQVASVDAELPTAVVYAPPDVPLAVRAYLTLMAAGALAFFARDLFDWARPRRGDKIVVEAFIPAPVETVWARSQEPAQHTRWDLRFTGITYTGETDARGFQAMRYETSLGFGLAVEGFGHYLHSTPLEHSTFEFDSHDWKSLITKGRGIWQYQAVPGGTRFRTVFDYGVRYGCVGYWLDRLVFRRVMRFATEWSFETLRLWCRGDERAPVRRKSWALFGAFMLLRCFGLSPGRQKALSWLGAGTLAERPA